MAEQMRPSSKQDAPNPAHSYERTDPNREAGQGSLEKIEPDPTNKRDQIQETPHNRSDPQRQLNAEEVIKGAERNQPDHSMFDEEPTDPDLATKLVKVPA